MSFESVHVLSDGSVVGEDRVSSKLGPDGLAGWKVDTEFSALGIETGTVVDADVEEEVILNFDVHLATRELCGTSSDVRGLCKSLVPLDGTRDGVH